MFLSRKDEKGNVFTRYGAVDKILKINGMAPLPPLPEDKPLSSVVPILNEQSAMNESATINENDVLEMQFVFFAKIEQNSKIIMFLV